MVLDEINNYIMPGVLLQSSFDGMVDHCRRCKRWAGEPFLTYQKEKYQKKNLI